MWATKSGRSTQRRAVVAAAAIVLVAGAALTGCTASHHAAASSSETAAPASSAVPRTATPTSGPTGGASVGTTQPASQVGGNTYQPVPPGAVVAVGDITSTDGKTKGHVAVKNVVGYKYDVIISGYQTNVASPRSVSFAASAMPTPAQCAEGSDQISVGVVQPNVDQVITAYLPVDKTGGDPTNLTSLSFGGASSDASGCYSAVTAHATLTWSFPHRYQHIAVVDSGPRQGAMGTVTQKNGVPTRYTVAIDDTMTGVLGRLGLTIDQLQYLNPGSFVQGVDSVPQQGFTWNLSLADR